MKRDGLRRRSARRFCEWRLRRLSPLRLRLKRCGDFRASWRKSHDARGSCPQRLKPALKNKPVIAAVNRCATQKQQPSTTSSDILRLVSSQVASTVLPATKIVPDERQQQAIGHVHGPMLVIAGAGTGKTTVLTQRVANLIREGHARPDEILALTYTDNSPAEMMPPAPPELKVTSTAVLHTVP